MAVGELVGELGRDLEEVAMNDVVIVFFFQAEDGIRDVAVTGVQTCALPISSACWTARTATSRAPRSCLAFTATPSAGRSKSTSSIPTATGAVRADSSRYWQDRKSVV